MAAIARLISIGLALFGAIIWTYACSVEDLELKLHFKATATFICVGSVYAIGHGIFLLLEGQ